MKLLLTQELGRLAKWLRILGFDTEYTREEKFSKVILEALKEDRVIITKRKKIYEHPGVKFIKVNSDSYKEQLKEILSFLKDYIKEEKKFTRCNICNTQIKEIEKEKVKDKVPEYVFITQKKFYFCPKCNKIYWQGSHWQKVEELLKEVL